MDGERAVRSDRLLDGKPRKLVAEDDPRRLRPEHARGEALLQFVRRPVEERLQQPELRLRRDERNRFEQGSSSR